MVVFVDLESEDEESHNRSTTLTLLLRSEAIPGDGQSRSKNQPKNDNSLLTRNAGLAAAVGCYPYEQAPRCY